MSLTDTFKNTLSALTEDGLNRYRLDITVLYCSTGCGRI
ncbi:Uncharacterised protein [Citrobacter braakii]|nr:Uncharacterised protein [Citrobacter braakii]